MLQIFQRLIYADKRDTQGDGPFPDGINVTIRRNYIYEDAYDKLSPENGTACITTVSVNSHFTCEVKGTAL